MLGCRFGFMIAGKGAGCFFHWEFHLGFARKGGRSGRSGGAGVAYVPLATNRKPRSLTPTIRPGSPPATTLQQLRSSSSSMQLNPGSSS
ncbi:hypothetical protein NDU88_008262 [Pleurodeles waltl]|uniref:Uncharacterized protein n=1 Tax=Pleurodeles waltl TaxID=8319 RepID=A0AAV7VS11_PLEWA|nr:hypothetical protein NDU88_008262 [Pleurodeles waltl]